MTSLLSAATMTFTSHTQQYEVNTQSIGHYCSALAEDDQCLL